MWLTFTNPRLYTSFEIVCLEGDSYVTKGSMTRSMFIVALLSLISTALKTWRRRKSCRILRGFGAFLFIPLVRMTRATLASAGSQMLFSALAWAFSLVSCISERRYSSVYLIALSSAPPPPSLKDSYNNLPIRIKWLYSPIRTAS